MESAEETPEFDLHLDFRLIINLEVDFNEYLLIEINQINGIKFLKVRDSEDRLIANSLKIESLAIDTNPDYIYLENDGIAQLLIERQILVLVKEFADARLECQLLILNDFNSSAEI